MSTATLTTAWPTFETGMKIRFTEEKQAYTVQAVSRTGRYVVCTKPFNARRTTLYTVMDLALGVRGPGTSWMCDAQTPDACRDTAAMFEANDTYAALWAAGKPIDENSPQWLAEHPDLVSNDGRRFPRHCEISFRNWVWIRVDDRQNDPRTTALIAELRALVAAAPARTYNDLAPRTSEELAYVR